MIIKQKNLIWTNKNPFCAYWINLCDFYYPQKCMVIILKFHQMTTLEGTKAYIFSSNWWLLMDLQLTMLQLVFQQCKRSQLTKYFSICLDPDYSSTIQLNLRSCLFSPHNSVVYKHSIEEHFLFVHQHRTVFGNSVIVLHLNKKLH